jgi:hypothetical protein
MADEPPPNGLLVSMVNDTFTVPFAGRVMVGVEKWQLTPGGSDAQPSPILSVKPSSEVSVTVTVTLCVVATDTLGGDTVRVKAVVLFTVVRSEVEGRWDVSPL